jgi:hypothetical protein
MIVHLLDIEWLLSTLFDASLFNFRAAGNGGSFFALSHFGSNREAACAAAEAAKRQTPQLFAVRARIRGRPATMSARSLSGCWTWRRRRSNPVVGVAQKDQEFLFL